MESMAKIKATIVSKVLSNENPISTMNTTLEAALLFGWINHALVAIGAFV